MYFNHSWEQYRPITEKINNDHKYSFVTNKRTPNELIRKIANVFFNNHCLQLINIVERITLLIWFQRIGSTMNQIRCRLSERAEGLLGRAGVPQ